MNNINNHSSHFKGLITAVNQNNLVYNYNFLYFSNADYSVKPVNYGTPDGWVYSDPGELGGICYSDETVIIKTSNDNNSNMQFKQALNEFPRWESTLSNKTITAKIYINVTAESLVKVSLSDGINTSCESRFSEDINDIIFDLQLQIDENFIELTVLLECQSNEATIKISKIYANIGDIAVENLPCIVQGIIGETKQYLVTENPPANELSLCEQAVELPKVGMSRLNSVINGRFGLSEDGQSLLPDVRGYFMRAWDNGAIIDPDANERKALGKSSTNIGDKVGTWQQDIFKEHHHKISFSKSTLIPSGDKIPCYPVIEKQDNTTDEGGNETRSINISELYTIKWA
jgi:hypothetical protein